MDAICILDCAFAPAPEKYPVAEIMEMELSRIADSFRLDTVYDHVVEPSFDPELYLKLGYEYVPVASGRTPLELAVEAIRQLLKRNELDADSIDAFIYYDAIPWPDDATVNLPSRAAELVGLNKLKYCSHVSQRNCSSGLAAVEFARYLMIARPDIDLVLIAGGDCVAAHCGEPRVVRNLIFGDAGSAALIARNGSPIHYLESRFVPIGGRRYFEPIESLMELSMKGFHWSFAELEKALTAAGMALDDMEFIVSNNPPLERVMNQKPNFPAEKRQILVDNVRQNALTTAHIAMGCIEELLRRGTGRPAIVHATGLGTNFSTMIFSPQPRNT